MPRKAKTSPGHGGPRAGTPGKKYPNRTDMPGKVLPIQAAKGQTYGDRKAQEEAQRAVPMGSPGAAPPGGPPVPVPPAGMPKPGSLPPLDAASGRPDEPVTAGAAMGAGPGVGALGPDPDEMMRQGDLQALSKWLPVLEWKASQPGVTPSFIQLVRRVRGSV